LGDHRQPHRRRSREPPAEVPRARACPNHRGRRAAAPARDRDGARRAGGGAAQHGAPRTYGLRAGPERALPRGLPEGRGGRRAPRRAGAGRSERVSAMAKKNLLDPIPHPPRPLVPGHPPARATTPPPPRTFVRGTLLSLTTTTPVQDMMKLAREYGPIYWLDMLGKPVV